MGIISHDLFKAIVMEHSYERGVQKHHRDFKRCDKILLPQNVRRVLDELDSP